MQDAWLASANAMIAERRRAGPLCAPNYRADAADILPNVIERFFVGGTQERAAQLGRRRHDMLPLVQELETLLATASPGALPQAYRRWQQARDDGLERLAAAPAGHVKELQALLSPCGDRRAAPAER